MRRRGCIYIITGILLLALTACGKKTVSEQSRTHRIPQKPLRLTEDEEEEIANIPADPLFTEYEDVYNVEMWSKEQTGIEQATGICVVENSVYVCDQVGNCVVELDLDGNYVATHGALGAEEGNFTRPIAIVYHEEKLYVLDYGNSRIQIFDKKMNYQREVPYRGSGLGPYDAFVDLAVDRDGTIYLSTFTSFINDMAVYYISEGGMLEKLTPKMTAMLTEYNGQVYVLNQMIPCYVGSDIQSAIPAENFLLTCSKDGLEQIGELPYKYIPGDFCIVDDVVYTLSMGGTDSIQMNRLNMDGTLDSAVYIFPDEEREYDRNDWTRRSFPWYLHVVSDDLIYTVDYGAGSIYRLQKKQ